MAASIIRDAIQTQVYNCSKYLFMDNTDDALSVVPDSLNRFIHGIIKSKDTHKMKSETGCTSIAHAVISACRPRSFSLSILLSVAVYINRRYVPNKLKLIAQLQQVR